MRPLEHVGKQPQNRELGALDDHPLLLRCLAAIFNQQREFVDEGTDRGMEFRSRAADIVFGFRRLPDESRLGTGNGEGFLDGVEHPPDSPQADVQLFGDLDPGLASLQTGEDLVEKHQVLDP